MKPTQLIILTMMLVATLIITITLSNTVSSLGIVEAVMFSILTVSLSGNFVRRVYFEF